jgi:uncharacterized protein
MKTRKEKAIDLILLGMAIQWIPSAILRMDIQWIPFAILGGFFVGLDKLWSIFGLLGYIFFIIGYIFFIKGCLLYAQSKGYVAA